MFRLAQLLTSDTRQTLSTEIKGDMKKFLCELENEDIDLQSIGVRGADKKTIISVVCQCYELKE